VGFAGEQDGFDLGHDEFLERERVANRFKSHAMRSHASHNEEEVWPCQAYEIKSHAIFDGQSRDWSMAVRKRLS
jgi:hypothetical protein